MADPATSSIFSPSPYSPLAQAAYSPIFIFEQSLNISRALQSPSCDLIAAVEMIKSLVMEYQDARDNPTETFSSIFAKAKEFAEECQMPIRIPRTSRAQEQNPEDYYCIHVFIPILDTMIAQLTERLDNIFHKAALGYCLIPAFMNDHNPEVDIIPFAETYGCDLPPLSSLQAEIRQWKRKWDASLIISPRTAIDAMASADPLFFPGLRMALKILSTLTVTTSTPERSFSSLTRLKTYLRNSMKTERMDGLALMNIHREVDIPTANVLRSFTAAKGRRLKLNILSQ